MGESIVFSKNNTKAMDIKMQKKKKPTMYLENISQLWMDHRPKHKSHKTFKG